MLGVQLAWARSATIAVEPATDTQPVSLRGVAGAPDMASDEPRKRTRQEIIVEAQAGDKHLWFEPLTENELYLQHAIKHLHASIQGKRCCGEGWDRVRKRGPLSWWNANR